MDEKIKLGSITTIGSSLVGGVLNVAEQTQDAVIFWLQVIAFVISIVVGIYTICYTRKKMKIINNNKNSEK